MPAIYFLVVILKEERLKDLILYNLRFPGFIVITMGNKMLILLFVIAVQSIHPNA